MKVMCLNTLNKGQTRLHLSQPILVAAIFFAAAATSLAQDSWSVWQVPNSGYVQPTTYETAVTDLQPPGEVLSGEDVVVYQDHPPGAELWDPTALGPDCGYSCPPAWRLDASYFFLKREGAEGLTLSPNFRLDEYTHEHGVRFTRARHFDCLDAFEITYMGPFEWNSSASASGVGLGFLPVAGPGVTLNSFNNATLQSQHYRTRFNSLEMNSKWVGWDVFTQTLGVRYWTISEDYTFRSTSAAGSGVYGLDTDNHALGVQYGIEMYFPLGRWKTETWMKGGIFGNMTDAGSFLTDAGTVQFANSDEDLDFAAMGELGIDVSYRVAPNVQLHYGYEIWWLYGAALAPDQAVGVLTTTTGSRVAGKEDTWYHGGTLGIEVIW